MLFPAERHRSAEEWASARSCRNRHAVVTADRSPLHVCLAPRSFWGVFHILPNLMLKTTLWDWGPHSRVDRTDTRCYLFSTLCESGLSPGLWTSRPVLSHHPRSREQGLQRWAGGALTATGTVGWREGLVDSSRGGRRQPGREVAAPRSCVLLG